VRPTWARRPLPLTTLGPKPPGRSCVPTSNRGPRPSGLRAHGGGSRSVAGLKLPAGHPIPDGNASPFAGLPDALRGNQPSCRPRAPSAASHPRRPKNSTGKRVLDLGSPARRWRSSSPWSCLQKSRVWWPQSRSYLNDTRNALRPPASHSLATAPTQLSTTTQQPLAPPSGIVRRHPRSKLDRGGQRKLDRRATASASWWRRLGPGVVVTTLVRDLGRRERVHPRDEQDPRDARRRPPRRGQEGRGDRQKQRPPTLRAT